MAVPSRSRAANCSHIAWVAALAALASLQPLAVRPPGDGFFTNFYALERLAYVDACSSPSLHLIDNYGADPSEWGLAGRLGLVKQLYSLLSQIVPRQKQ